MFNHSDVKDRVEKKRTYYKETLSKIMEKEFVPYFLNHEELNERIELAMLRQEKTVEVFLSTRIPIVLGLWVRIEDMIDESCFKAGFFKNKQIKFKDVDLQAFLDELPSVDHSETFIEEILVETNLYLDLKNALEDRGYKISLERKPISSSATVPCVTIFLD